MPSGFGRIGQAMTRTALAVGALPADGLFAR
jgi:hypothetical protein